MDIEYVHKWRGGQGQLKRCFCSKTPNDECQHGHPRNDKDAYRNDRGVWICRVCQRNRVKWWRESQATPDMQERIRDRNRQTQADIFKRRRQAVLDAYGARCKCCGETELLFLTIDHVNNDGNLHRAELNGEANKRAGSSMKVLRDIELRGYPPEFQILCYNCNCGKHRNGGVCPHTTKSEVI